MEKSTDKNYLADLFCPLCHTPVTRSSYLTNEFRDRPKAGYLAHLVTHYRHNHIESWNRCWEYGGHRYRSNWFGDYDEEKQKVNERAKRQLIRKGKDVLIQLGITPRDFTELQGTEGKTLEVATKYLNG